MQVLQACPLAGPCRTSHHRLVSQHSPSARPTQTDSARTMVCPRQFPLPRPLPAAATSSNMAPVPSSPYQPRRTAFTKFRKGFALNSSTHALSKSNLSSLEQWPALLPHDSTSSSGHERDFERASVSTHDPGAELSRSFTSIFQLGPTHSRPNAKPARDKSEKPLKHWSYFADDHTGEVFVTLTL